MNESLKENLKPAIFIVIVLVLAAISAYPQRKFNGRVVEVIDGKTCVIQLPAGKVTAVLQYIEVPEPEQPLAQTVKDHLRKLVFEQQVEFLPRIVKKDRTVGQMMVKGVDVSQQMLRDGAAWYSIPEKSGQDEAQGLLYQDNESLAKNEKRGVWGVKDLIPSWEYRADQALLAKQKEREALEKMRLSGDVRNQPRGQAQPRQNAPPVEMWANVGGAGDFGQPYGAGGLLSYNDQSNRIGFIFTPSVYLDFPGGDFLRKVESRVFYGFTDDVRYTEKSVYLIGFLAASKEFKFAKSNDLIIVADGETISLGSARRYFDRDLSAVSELLLYRIKRAHLLKMVKAKKISVRLGTQKGELSGDSLMYLNNLLNVS